MLFIMISAYKSMYGQDKRITLIHMLSANVVTGADCYSSTLGTGGVVAWNQQCSMTSQKSFIFSEPARKG